MIPLPLGTLAPPHAVASPFVPLQPSNVTMLWLWPTAPTFQSNPESWSDVHSKPAVCASFSRSKAALTLLLPTAMCAAPKGVKCSPALHGGLFTGTPTAHVPYSLADAVVGITNPAASTSSGATLMRSFLDIANRSFAVLKVASGRSSCQRKRSRAITLARLSAPMLWHAKIRLAAPVASAIATRPTCATTEDLANSPCYAVSNGAARLPREVVI